MTREDVIREIVEREQQNQSLDETEVNATFPGLYVAATDHFGTWDTALHYCGINSRRVLLAHYTKHDVLRRLRRLCLNGNGLSAQQNMVRHRFLYEAARRHFRTWRRALVELGLNMKCIHRWPMERAKDKDLVLRSIRAHHEQGRSLVWSIVCLENHGLAMAAKSAFGSWRRAIETAGYESRRYTRWTKERVIEAIVLRHRKGKDVSHGATQKEDGALACAIRRYFESWSAALEEAGLSRFDT